MRREVPGFFAYLRWLAYVAPFGQFSESMGCASDANEFFTNVRARYAADNVDAF